LTPLEPAALDAVDLEHAYGARRALQGVSLSIAPGEVFALVGPNGGGKTTLFRIAATLMRPLGGALRIFGLDVNSQASLVRRRIGVVFQSPALDVRLTVDENLQHHARLYGMRVAGHRAAMTEALERVSLQDRRRDLVSSLSGGLMRRAEIAKVLIHAPSLLLLDEPTTGLDPAARRDLWSDLDRLRDEAGTTVVVTTHLMEEAARCDRVAILHEGRIVTVGAPSALVESIGGEVIVIAAADAAGLAARIRARFNVAAEVIDGRVRIEAPRAHELVTAVIQAFPGESDTVSFGRPTLEDVFVHHTGRQWQVS
jgi:ABC-2 type transport system ATP-binding protein